MDFHRTDAFPPGKSARAVPRVRHEDGVVDECGVADDISNRRRCMTWRKDHLNIELADPEALAIFEQPVPL